jgi:flagellar biosynthesis/type III secretory pathway M-ring protein FliF/YscJ
VNNKNKVQQIRHNLTKSERKIKSMMVRIKKNKFIVRGVIAFIIIIFIVALILYLK